MPKFVIDAYLLPRYAPASRSHVIDLLFPGAEDRSGMAELTVRAAAHRWQLGDPAGRDAARALGAGIDNPALPELLE
jgi:hypothetical protein